MYTIPRIGIFVSCPQFKRGQFISSDRNIVQHVPSPFRYLFSLISGENSLVQIFYYTPRVPKRIQEIARRIEFDDISKRHGSSTRKQKSFEDGGEKFRRGVKLPLWEHGGKGQATSTGDDPGNNVPPTFTHPHAHPCCVCIFAKNARTEWQGRAVNSRWEFEEPCSTPPLLECVSSPIFVLQAWERCLNV